MIAAASTISLTHDRHRDLGLDLPDFATLLTRQLAATDPARRPSLPEHLLVPLVNLINFQAICRTLLAKQKYSLQLRHRVRRTRQADTSCDSVRSVMSEVSIHGTPRLIALQARIRTKQQRDKFAARPTLAARMQAHCRGVLARKRWTSQQVGSGGGDEVTVVAALQAVARGFIVRRAVRSIKAYLTTPDRLGFVVSLQSIARGHRVRRSAALLRLRLWVAEPGVLALQAQCRRVLARRRAHERRAPAAALMSDLVGLQAVVKRLLTLKELADQRSEQWIEVVAPTPGRLVEVETEPEVDRIVRLRPPSPVPPRSAQGAIRVSEAATLSSAATAGLDPLSQRMVDLLTELEAIEGEVTEFDTLVGMAVWHREADKTSKADEAWLRLVLGRANGRALFEVDERGQSLARGICGLDLD